VVRQAGVSLHLRHPTDGLENRSRRLRVLHGMGSRLLEDIQRTDELRAAVAARWRRRLMSLGLLRCGLFSCARGKRGSGKEWDAEAQPCGRLHAATSRSVHAGAGFLCTVGGSLVNRALPH
jgi:hypothetical protein